MDEQRPVLGVGKCRVLVPDEASERAAAQLDQVQALAAGAVVAQPIAAESSQAVPRSA